LAISANLYLSFLMTDYIGSQITVDDEYLANLRLLLAWIITVLLAATILVNLIFAFVTGICRFINYLRRRNLETARDKIHLGVRSLVINNCSNTTILMKKSICQIRFQLALMLLESKTNKLRSILARKCEKPNGIGPSKTRKTRRRLRKRRELMMLSINCELG
jgi:hypothetical protein